MTAIHSDDMTLLAGSSIAEEGKRRERMMDSNFSLFAWLHLNGAGLDLQRGNWEVVPQHYYHMLRTVFPETSTVLPHK